MKKEIDYIMSKGFRFIKIELEATVGDNDIYQTIGEELEFWLQDQQIETHYFSAYLDGTVDCEVTLTISITDYSKLPAIIGKFKQLCLEYGDCNISNAGMHISVLETGAIESSSVSLSSLTNMNEPIGQVVPLLYLLASRGDGTTRRLSFRSPKFSTGDKYSAVYCSKNRYLEFRIFDPCYDKPERVLHFLKVIAKVLRFYKITKHPVKINKEVEAITAPSLSKIISSTDSHYSGFRFTQILDDSDKEPIKLMARKLGIGKKVDEVMECSDWINKLAKLEL